MEVSKTTAEAVEDTDAGAKAKSMILKKRLAIGGIGIAVIVGTFVFILPRIADYRSVWDVVQDLTWPQIGVLLLATLANLATYAPPWMAALPGLGYRQGSVLTLASTSSTYIAPGGAAVGMATSYAMLRGWGFKGRPVTIAVAVTGVWNQFAMLGFPLIALAALTLQHEQDSLLQTVALIGLAVFVVAVGAFAAGLSTPRLARRVGDLAARVSNAGLRLVRRAPVTWDGKSFVKFRNETVRLLVRRWHVLTLATLAGQLTVFVLMLASLRVCGVSAGDVTFIEAFAAWSLARLLGSLPITPGGLGIVEVGLTTALVGFGGHNADVVAAVLIYRFLSIVPTLLLGLLAAATWRRHNPKLAGSTS
ncbi:MAG TPA: lysylphosphatidylglycerol synthase transmembrane domain-containing protein [Gaiellaceae bacterium]|nr:lysylphosphatidylglycerol synthase transmembrane domain-containing protein [Gaiellaceae bacterium]